MKRDKTEELQTERDYSKFLEELLMALYGDGWDQLTIYEAKKKNAEIAALKRDNEVMEALNDSFPEEIAKLEDRVAKLTAENKDLFEQGTSIMHDQGAENILLKEEIATLRGAVGIKMGD